MTSTIWQCPNCGEEHTEEFRLCWKCGTNPAGERDPDFRVSEPASEADQAPEAPEERPLPLSKQLHLLRLPTYSYFCIPVYICLVMIIHLKYLAANEWPKFPPPVSESFVIIWGAILIGIPVFATMVQLFYFSIRQNIKFPQDWSDFFIVFLIFRLPKPVRESYRWFVPIYYGSLAAAILSPPAVGIWLLVRSWN